MTINEIKETINKNGKVSFKLYALTYIIEKGEDGLYFIYSISMPNSKRYYKSLDDLLSKYRIFGDNIISSENRIKKI